MQPRSFRRARSMLGALFLSCLGAAVAQAPPAAARPADPAAVRRDLLRRLDAQIDAAATKAHLDARIALDEALPVPYLGIDAEPGPGGMTVTAVYGMSGAKAAGIRVGDLLQAVAGQPVADRAAMALAIRGAPVGSKVELAVQREGKAMSVPCTLGRRPEEDEDEEEQFPDLPGLPPPSREPFALELAQLAPGSPPPHCRSALGGHGRPGHWMVALDGPQRVLRQDEADPTGIRFPLLLAEGFDAADVVASVRLRYVAGEIDKAGGIVLRYRDPGNYYVARVNAAEGDLRIFRVCNGQRRTLPGGIAKGATDDGAWHTLEFRIEGSRLSATLDGKVTATAWDSFFLRGGAGLWTKSDSITEFAAVKFEPANPK